MKSISAIILAALFAIIIASSSVRAEPVSQQQEVRPGEPTSLPRYLTEEEKLLPPLEMPTRFAPPTGSV